MKLTTTLGAAAAAFAAYVYLKRNRADTGADAAVFSSASDDDATPRDDAGLATRSVTGTGMPGTGAESPNIAERMKAAGVQATAAASEGVAGGRSSEELFGSSSQQGSGPTSTGLPDLTRGA